MKCSSTQKDLKFFTSPNSILSKTETSATFHVNVIESEVNFRNLCNYSFEKIKFTQFIANDGSAPSEVTQPYYLPACNYKTHLGSLSLL